MPDQNSKELIIERVFDAPRETVWKAWTEPEQIKKWWGPMSDTTGQGWNESFDKLSEAIK